MAKTTYRVDVPCFSLRADSRQLGCAFLPHSFVLIIPDLIRPSDCCGALPIFFSPLFKEEST